MSVDEIMSCMAEMCNWIKLNPETRHGKAVDEAMDILMQVKMWEDRLMDEAEREKAADGLVYDNDLISRRAVKTALLFMPYLDGMSVEKMHKIFDAVDSIPSVRQENNTGEWKKADGIFFDGIFFCTCCNKAMPFISDYCPNCGAEMKPYKEDEKNG